MPRHPPNALKSLDALIINVHPLLVVSLTLTSGVSDLGRSDGQTQIYKKDLYVLDLPAAERSSSCVPRQSAIQGTVPFGSIPSMPGLRAMQANPFIHDVNQQDASSLQSGETGLGGLNGQMPEYNTVRNGGARRDRTDDLKLAKLPLSQLSYGPVLPTRPEASLFDQPQSGGPGKTRTSDLTLIKRAL